MPCEPGHPQEGVDRRCAELRKDCHDKKGRHVAVTHLSVKALQFSISSLSIFSASRVWHVSTGELHPCLRTGGAVLEKAGGLEKEQHVNNETDICESRATADSYISGQRVMGSSVQGVRSRKKSISEMTKRCTGL